MGEIGESVRPRLKIKEMVTVTSYLPVRLGRNISVAGKLRLHLNECKKGVQTGIKKNLAESCNCEITCAAATNSASSIAQNTGGPPPLFEHENNPVFYCVCGSGRGRLSSGHGGARHVPAIAVEDCGRWKSWFFLTRFFGQRI